MQDEAGFYMNKSTLNTAVFAFALTRAKQRLKGIFYFIYAWINNFI